MWLKMKTKFCNIPHLVIWEITHPIHKLDAHMHAWQGWTYTTKLTWQENIYHDGISDLQVKMQVVLMQISVLLVSCFVAVRLSALISAVYLNVKNRERLAQWCTTWHNCCNMESGYRSSVALNSRQAGQTELSVIKYGAESRVVEDHAHFTTFIISQRSKFLDQWFLTCVRVNPRGSAEPPPRR